MKDLMLKDLTTEEMVNIEGGNWLGDFFHGAGKVCMALGDWMDSWF